MNMNQLNNRFKFILKLVTKQVPEVSLNLLIGKDDLPSVDEFINHHVQMVQQKLDCQKQFTTDMQSINIVQKVFKNHGIKESKFFENNILKLPKKHTNECGSIKVFISSIEDFPQFKETAAKSGNRMLCIGGPAAEDQVVLSGLIDSIRLQLNKITYLTHDYKESNVNHSANQSHARHGNALNADESLTGHALLPVFIARKLFGVELKEVLDPDYKKIDIKFEINPKKLKIYLGNEINWFKQKYNQLLDKLTEHDINRIESVLSQEILHVVEKQTGLELSGNNNRNRQDSSSIHVIFSEKNNQEVKHENEEFAKVGIKSLELTKDEKKYFFPHSKDILNCFKYIGDTHLKFDTHERNQRYANKIGIDWIEAEVIERLLFIKNKDGNAEATGVITKQGTFIPANKMHMTGGYKVTYEFDNKSASRFKSSSIRNLVNRIQDKLGLQKPLSNELTTATGVSMNLIFKNTPELSKVLKSHGGFEFAVTNSHWSPIAWDNDHIIVRATGGGNTGSEEYNPTYLLNVLANTRRIFGDALIGILSSYGCSRAVNSKNSTEFAKIAEGCVISYGKGGTGNTKRHAEAVFALIELGFKNEITNYFNKFKTAEGKLIGNEIVKVHEKSIKCNFIHDIIYTTNRRMGYDGSLMSLFKF